MFGIKNQNTIIFYVLIFLLFMVLYIAIKKTIKHMKKINKNKNKPHKKSCAKHNKHKAKKHEQHDDETSSSDDETEHASTMPHPHIKENMTLTTDSTQYNAIQCYSNTNNRHGIISYNTYQTENTETLCK